MSPPVIILHEQDDVGVAATAIDAGTQVGDDLTAIDRIPPAHKIARHAIDAGAPVHKYGQVIGFATKPIAAGARA